MLGSQTLKVLAGAKIAVLVSNVARNAEHSARDAAIATIKDEHRSLASVLHALRRIVAEAPERKTLDTKLLRGAIHYLRAFPQTLHHPKEERYLFKRARSLGRARSRAGRAGAAARQRRDAPRRRRRRRRRLQASAGLGDSAQRGARCLHGRAMATHGNGGADRPARGARASGRPRLGRIADAFGRNGDPRFDRFVDDDFREMFARMMNLTPPAGDGSPSRNAGREHS